MRSVIFAFTERGKATARRVEAQLDGEIALYAPARLAGEGFEAYTGALPEFVGTAFDRDALIFVGATGIAMRAVAPHVASKRSDPAVIVHGRGGAVRDPAALRPHRRGERPGPAAGRRRWTPRR